MAKRREFAKLGLAAVFVVMIAIGGYAIAAAAPAMQDTATATPSLTPPANMLAATSTAQPTYSSTLDCPIGTPAGWGTVTPGALWMLSCSSCGPANTATPATTATPAGYEMTATIAAMTATATRTATPTGITPSPTVTPTTKLSCSTITAPSCAYGWPQPDQHSLTCEEYGNGLKITLHLRNYPTGDFCYRRAVNWTDPRGGTVSYWWRHDTYAGGTFIWNPQAWNGTTYCTGPADNCVAVGDVHTSGTTSTSVRTAEYQIAQHYNKTSIFDDVLYIYPFNGIPATPAAPTPQAGLCGTVLPEPSIGFGWEGIVYGATECIDVGPVNWEEILPSWITGTIALPAIPWIAHICFQQVAIGAIEVFGVWLYLSTFVFLAGVVMIVNIAIRK